MLPADRLILDLVELSLLHPAVLELAVSKASERLSGRGCEREKRRADLSVAIADTYRELLHLTSAIAAGAGGNLVSIVQAISEREVRKAVLTSELASLGEQVASVRLDAATVKARIAAAIGDWQTTIRKHVPQARSLLRKLLRGRITVQPEARDDVPGFRFHDDGTIQAALAGWFPDHSQGVASPTGNGRLWSYRIGRLVKLAA